MNYININNRRYLGNKYKLLPFITDVIKKECSEIDSFIDLFAGTGVVASAFIDKTIITNDILYSNYLSHIAWFSPMEFDAIKVENYIEKYNNVETIENDNYMSLTFADTYFDYNTCKKIGFIRDDIEESFESNKINFKERAILITSLLYSMDKIANTCGHYDAYRKGAEFKNDLYLKIPKMPTHISDTNKCFNTDSNELVKTINADLVYIDPPYNSRQYSDAYHLLENVAIWEKPEVKGVARKMDRSGLKSDYCTSNATSAFEDLIKNINSRYILVSYNNMGNSGHSRSNAKISDEDIIRILSRKGTVKTFSQDYKAFTTGKSENESNKERLFLCTTNKNHFIPSPLNYTGGKFKLMNQIYPIFPSKIDTFVDIFCGGCNVGINVNANSHIYNDLNEPLISIYNTFKSLPIDTIFKKIDDIINIYNLSNSSKNGYEFYGCNSSNGLSAYNKEKYNKLRDDFNELVDHDEEYSLLLYVLIVFGFNNQIRFNKKGHFNLPVGKRDFNFTVQTKLRNFVHRIKEQNALFTSVKFDELDTSMLTSNSFIYCDPPYLISTATYNENNGWNESDELNLLAFLDRIDNRNIRFALSNVLSHKGKTNEILVNWFNVNSSRYKMHALNFNYHNSNYQVKDKLSETQEILITNY